MSLVNDVLRDLERRHGPLDRNSVPGVRPSAPEGRRVGWTAVVLVLFLFGSTTMAAWLIWSAKGASNAGSPPDEPLSAQRPDRVEPERAAPQAAEQSPRRLHSVTHTVEPQRLRIVFGLDGTVHHRSEYDAERHRASLYLENAELSATLPALVSIDDRLRALDVSHVSEGLRLTFQLSEPARLQTALANTGDGVALTLDLQFRAEAAPAANASTAVVAQASPPAADRPELPTRPVSSGTEVTVPQQSGRAAPDAEAGPERKAKRATPDAEAPRTRVRSDSRGTARAARELAIAEQELARGRTDAARQRLEHLLELEPEHHAARAVWIRLLLRQGQTAEATRELALAVRRWPDQTAYAGLYGRMLLQSGKAAEAARILESVRGEMGGDAEYQALLAAAYQRSGRHEEAAQLYSGLLQVNPRHGPWWLGLAVSAEDSGDTEKALLGYRRALAAEGLQPAVRQYAEQRLQALTR